jgi:hypothetical protein
MIYFLALIPATALSVAGYFILYLSNRSEGAFRTFGKYLGFWAFTLAGLVVLGAIFAAAHGGHHGAMVTARGMHGRMHAPWPGDPRFLGPGMDEEPCEGGQVGETQREANPPPPSGAPSSTAPPRPESTPAR